MMVRAIWARADSTRQERAGRVGAAKFKWKGLAMAAMRVVEIVHIDEMRGRLLMRV